jgi:hypothetical protein
MAYLFLFSHCLFLRSALRSYVLCRDLWPFFSSAHFGSKDLHSIGRIDLDNSEFCIHSLTIGKDLQSRNPGGRIQGGPNWMAYNEPAGNYGTMLFTKEVFYLAVGCTLLLAIHWLREKMFLSESP